MAGGFKLQWIVEEKDEGKVLKNFLVGQEISRAALTDIKFKGGGMFVNGDSVTVRHLLKTGDRLEVHFPPEKPSMGLTGEDLPLNVIYDDPYLLVVNKPAGMNTIPSREHPIGSLANGLIGYYQQVGIEATTHIITRLDRNTSGIVLIAKHRHVHHLMSKQQQMGHLQRVYEALVQGHIQELNGYIEVPIARKDTSIIEREVHPGGQYAYTSYRLIKLFDSFSHIELLLKTGRTHQIRVHMSYINHPLLGDTLYGGTAGKIRRQALHCREVQFIHPFTKQQMKFSVPLPGDIQDVLNSGRPI
mgnify:CR=1 FL=1